MSADELYKEFVPEPIICFDKRPLPEGVPEHVIVLGGKKCELVSLIEAEIFLSGFESTLVYQKLLFR